MWPVIILWRRIVLDVEFGTGLAGDANMSKEFPQFGEEEASQPKPSAKQKRSAVARGRKPVVEKPEKPEKPAKPEAKEPEVLKAPVAGAKVTTPKPADGADPKWEEAVPESVGGGAVAGEGSSKRKRRRRKGKGGNSSAQAEGADAVVPTNPSSASAPASPQAPKVRMDPETLAKAAWKIYLAEVSEEGVALVGDQDARELARRCFRLAEIFLEERGRRMGS